MRWDILVAALALASCILSTLPLMVHIRKTNFAAIVLVLATMGLNLQTFINALIWPSSDLQSGWDGRIFCDIEVKLYIGLAMAILGAIASILRQTAIIMDPRSIMLSPSPKQQICKAIFEGTVCIAMPIIMMATHYIVQSDRYWILPVAGCTASFDQNWVMIVLMRVPPTIVSITGCIYCGLVILRMWKQRKESSSSSALALPAAATTSRSHFTRLSILALTVFLVCFPLSIYGLFQISLTKLHPFNWGFIHGPDWKKKIYKISGPPSIPPDRWLQIGVGFLYFVFFGTGGEAIEVYRSWIMWTQQGIQKVASLGTREESQGS